MSSHLAFLFLFVTTSWALNCQVCVDEAYAGMCVDQYDNGASKECPLGTVCAYFKDGNSHCLKITQNVSFEFSILTFFANFCPIKIDILVTLFDHKLHVEHFWHF